MERETKRQRWREEGKERQKQGEGRELRGQVGQALREHLAGAVQGRHRQDVGVLLPSLPLTLPKAQEIWAWPSPLDQPPSCPSSRHC